MYVDIDGDETQEFIFADESNIDVYYRDKSKMLSYSFDENIDDNPGLYRFAPDDIRIGVFIREKNKLYLLKNDGNLNNGFPLTGCTPFSVGIFDTDDTYELITGSNSSFLYKYKIQ